MADHYDNFDHLVSNGRVFSVDVSGKDLGRLS